MASIRRKISIFPALSTIFFAFFICPPLHCQLDLTQGKRLTDEINALQNVLKQEKQTDYVLWNSKQLIGTIEEEIVSQNMKDCDDLLAYARSQISNLYYGLALNAITKARTLADVVRQMQSEENVTDIATMRKSRTTEFVIPERTLTVTNPILKRAIIWNEIETASRMVKRTGASSLATGVRRLQNIPENVCTSTQDRLIDEIGDPSVFLQKAQEQLRLLDYNSAHESAYRVYSGTQSIFSACGMQ